MDTIIKIKDLEKKYDLESVINKISYDFNKGEFIGLLGVNGAGKTTLLKLLCGLLKPTDGNIDILGYSPWDERDKVLSKLGVMIETPVFYEHLSAYENIELHLKYLNVDANIDDILKSVGLLEVKDRAVSKFSLGMKQKLGIARAISHNPSILLLDEPINGLDPVAIKDMRDLFLSLQAKGTTIILSSHILGELIHTVQDIVILANGKIENLGAVSDLKKKHGDKMEDYLVERMRG